MRDIFIAGNWKMHGDQASVDALLQGLEPLNHVSVKTAVFPPYIHLAQVQKALHGSAVQLGAQNVDCHEQGAFTGEIAPGMLKDIGCDYVLVGHSERRQLFHETDESCANKVVSAQSVGLLPILCIGETAQERQQKQTLTIIEKQLAAVMKHDGVNADKLVIAYEPIWAIGTGKTATPDMVQEVHVFMRTLLRDWVGDVAEDILFLYGGSVKPSNAAELLAMPDIDGALVGGASLQADSFVAICRAVANEIINEERQQEEQ